MKPQTLAATLLPWLEAPLRHALRSQRGHGLLVAGGEGAGQLGFALALARAWLCEVPPEQREGEEACGHCPSCHLAQADQVHPDLAVLLPETMHVELGWWPRDNERDKIDAGKRKPSAWIGIDQVRAAIAFANRTRSRASGKVIVLDPAERLQTAAASALLKLLEEPPPGLRLVLATADAASLMPTVRSRCQALALPLPEARDAVRWLEAQGVADAEALLAAAGGQPLAAIEHRAAGLDAALWRRLPELISEGRAEPLAKLPLPLAIVCLQRYCHDAMAVGAGAAPRYFAAGSIAAAPARLAALAAWAQELARAASRASHPWNSQLLLEALVEQGRRAHSGAHAGEGEWLHFAR